MNLFKSKFGPISFSWNSLYIFTFIAAHLYVISEWVFITTKPSYLNAVPILRKASILIFSSSLLTGICFIGLSILYLFYLILRRKTNSKIILLLGCFIPVSVLTFLSIILLDNFTYTIFKFGIISTSGLATGLYLLAFLILLGFIYFRTAKLLSKLESVEERKPKRKWIVAIIWVYILFTLLLTYKGNDFGPIKPDIKIGQNNNKLPNILIITGDGIDASHTSAYGYEYDTTPNIKELAKTSLVAENAFTNAGNTAGSLISMYTSKYPTETRVLFPPDILKNMDSYQHFPGLLKSLGYYNVQLSTPYYADAYALNLLDGFDLSNGQYMQRSSVYNLISTYIQSDYAYFIYETSNRIIDRLRHIFFIKKMVNQFDLIMGSDQSLDDIKKINKTLKLFSQTNQPLFVHIHWMGTHGLKPTPESVFYNSRNIDTPEKRDDAIYDDNILEFDKGVGKLITELKNKKLFDDTILLISSDHNRNRLTTNRIPLLIHFPNDQYSGARKSDVQTMDIAPTLLDYMGIAKPAYMHGASFLREEMGNRPIFGTGIGNVNDPIRPPFYQFSYISVVYCNSWFKFNLTSLKYESGLVNGHTDPCAVNVVSEQQVTQWIIDHLKSEGFDVANIINSVGKE